MTVTDEILAVETGAIKIKPKHYELHNSQKCSVDVDIVVTKFSFVCRIREHFCYHSHVKEFCFMGLDLVSVVSLSHARASLLPRYTIVGVILALRPRYSRDGRHGEAGGQDQEVVRTRTRRHRWTRDLETHLGCKTE